MTLILMFVLLAVSAVVFFAFSRPEKKMDFKQEREADQERESEIENSKQENGDPVFLEEELIESESQNSQQPAAQEKSQEKESSQKKEKKDSGISSDLEIKSQLVAFGFSVSSGRKIDTIVIHSSYNSLGGDEYDTDKIIDIYKSYGVAAHYIIGRDGDIYKLVEEKNIAYHAGVSKVPDGRDNVNNFSIGIEMVGNRTDGYTEKQYEAVLKLVDDIKKRYDIRYVLGHKDIAPDRKDDPWLFDWSKLQ